MTRYAIVTLGILCAMTVLPAQTYRCDWSVVGIGGGEMSSSAYKCVATAGQTAAGFMTSPDYWALVGYWLPEGRTGVQEPANGRNPGPLVTRLYAPKPNPFRGAAAIHYTLAAQSQVSLQVHDLTGRVVKTIADGVQRPGRYSLRWDGRDNVGRLLANGVYFCRLKADGYTGAEKLVLQR
jgi:hypothetical protein